MIRWAGSKSKLLDQILPFVPTKFNRYFEPFFGSGALFFRLAPARAALGDLCAELVETYAAVRDNHKLVVRYLEPLQLDEQTYYEVRASKPRGRYQAAARFLYLNRGCWNGLYRVNTRGEFNVPFGRPKSSVVFDQQQLAKCAGLLGQTEVILKTRDFDATLSSVERGDFVFLDPPYVTKHNLNGFAEWNERIFSWADQERLAAAAVKLAGRGANVLVTNADHKDVVKLYPGFKRRTLTRQSTLAGDMSKRATVTEAILCGGPNAK